MADFFQGISNFVTGNTTGDPYHSGDPNAPGGHNTRDGTHWTKDGKQVSDATGQEVDYNGNAIAAPSPAAAAAGGTLGTVNAQQTPLIDPNAGIGTGYGAPPQSWQTQNANAGLASAQADVTYANGRRAAGRPYLAGTDTALAAAQLAQHQAYTADQQDAGRFSRMATGADQRQAPDVPMVGLDPYAGQNDYNNYQNDRNQSNQVYNAVQQRALGLGGPSVAEQQLQMGGQQSMQNALSLANSQRGGGGSLGTIEALRANAGTMSGVNQQTAMLRSQEQMQAQGLAGNMMNAQQAQDLSAWNQGFGHNLQAGQFQVGQNQYQAGLGMQQQGINAGRENMYLNAYQAELERQRQNALANQQAQLTMYGYQNGAGIAAAQLGQQAKLYNQNRTDQKNAAGMKAAGDAISTFAPALGKAIDKGAAGGGAGGAPTGGGSGGYDKPNYSDPGYNSDLGI